MENTEEPLAGQHKSSQYCHTHPTATGSLVQALLDEAQSVTELGGKKVQVKEAPELGDDIEFSYIPLI